MSENVLSAKQRKAIAAILSERTLTDAAKVTGVNPKTLTRWLADETFKRELKVAELAMIDETVRRLASISSKAVLILEWAMGAASKDATRVRAADIVLSRLMSLKETHDFEARVAALEGKNGKTRNTTGRARK